MSNDARVADLSAGLEEYLVAHFRFSIIPAFLLVILRRVDTASSERTRLTLDALADYLANGIKTVSVGKRPF